jgi:hypothetical protein
MTSYLATPSYLKYVYGAFSGRRREKLDYILEPLQALLQLSLLGFSPVGSKLTIKDNLLYIQQPGISQGIIRFFNDDTKEDLYYLFNVFRRFVVYYKHIYSDIRHKPLYELLIELSKRGLDKLIMTYTNTDRINVLHTLQMYKVILAKPDFVIPSQPTTTNHTTTNNTTTNNTTPNNNHHETGGKSGHKTGKNITKTETTEPTEHILSTQNQDNTNTTPTNTNTNNNIPELDLLGLGTSAGNIDNIFKNIVNIYSHEELSIIYNTLIILQRRGEDDGQTYIDGVNMILQPTYGKIKQWINDNIAL